MKRIVVCCDGTWNEPDQVRGGTESPSNITKIARMVANPCGTDGVEQRVFYDRGVGTGGRVDRLTGGAFGVGLSHNVREAYSFVVQNFEPGDELYFFGFSRGSFTARSAVGFIRNCGVLRREYADRLDEAYTLYRNAADEAHPNGVRAELFRRTYSHETRIRFVGVFDTVGALGIPLDGRLATLVNRRWQFHDTRLSSWVDGAFQALAINEHRGPFTPTLWSTPAAATQTLEQVWFTGVHSDIGGGYPESDLAGITLKWMASRAERFGLTFEPTAFADAVDGTEPDDVVSGRAVCSRALGQLHDSWTGIYRWLPDHVRSFASTPTGERIAGSVAYRARDGSFPSDESPTSFTDALDARPPVITEVAYTP